MTKITEKDEIDAIAANDLIYVRDASEPDNPDKKATAPGPYLRGRLFRRLRSVAGRR